MIKSYSVWFVTVKASKLCALLINIVVNCFLLCVYMLDTMPCVLYYFIFHSYSPSFSHQFVKLKCFIKCLIFLLPVHVHLHLRTIVYV